jgi:hypothetical protein
MVYPVSRSMNSELNEGATDGKYKKVVRDRGQAEGATHASRLDLDDYYYGIHEEPLKVRPDGKLVHTPNYVATPPVSM